MKKSLLCLSIGFLSVGLAAQTSNTLDALKAAGVSVKIKTGDKKVLTIGNLAKPVYLSVSEQGSAKGISAYGRMSVGLHGTSSFSKYSRIGGYLSNYGRVYGTATEKGEAQALAQDAAFQWKYSTGAKLNGTVKVSFNGSYQAGTAPIATFGTKTLTPTKVGYFRLTEEIPVKDAMGLDFKFGFTGATGIVEKGSYSGSLSFTYSPTPVLPSLTWKDNNQKNCAVGGLGLKGTVGWDKEFFITLSGATDAGKDAYAMLFMGTSDKKFFFWDLPLDLKKFGFDGCTLYTGFFFPRVVKIDKGGAEISYKINSTVFGRGWSSTFRPLYFQFAYATDKSMVFTDSASIK